MLIAERCNACEAHTAWGSQLAEERVALHAGHARERGMQEESHEDHEDMLRKHGRARALLHWHTFT